MKCRAQRGEAGFQTFLLLIFLVLFGRAAFSLVPIYYERSSATALLEEAIDESLLGDHSRREMMDNIQSKLSFNGIKHPAVSEMEIRREGRVYFLETQYSVTGKYMFDIELVVNFPPISIDVTDIVASR